MDLDFLSDQLEGINTWLGLWIRDHGDDALEVRPDDDTIDLLYVIRQWVEAGDGVWACGGDYKMLLRMALENACSIDRWSPIRGRRVILGTGHLPELLSPDWWADQVFHYTHAHKRASE